MPTFWKWDQPSRVDTAKAKKSAKEANWREVCRLVNIRDGYACRACGKPISLSAITLLEKGHHHHIEYRSHIGPDTTDNVCLLDSACHDAIHVKRTLRIEGNADRALTFSKKDEDDQWFVWRQEKEVGVYERD